MQAKVVRLHFFVFQKGMTYATNEIAELFRFGLCDSCNSCCFRFSTGLQIVLARDVRADAAGGTEQPGEGIGLPSAESEAERFMGNA